MTSAENPRNLPHLHVIYEYGLDYRPHSSPFLRLIRPFSHPLMQSHFYTTFDRDLSHDDPGLVVIDRLWRPDVTLHLVKELIDKIHRKGIPFIYSLDDNFFDLVLENKGWPPREFLPIVAHLLHQANCVWVTTPALRERLLEFNSNIIVLPNQLDERLLVIHHPEELDRSEGTNRIVIGYMGTYTHDEDFLLVLPALKAVCQRHPGSLEIQVVGVIRGDQTRKELEGLPVRYLNPHPHESEYPLFMLWFTGHVNWDIAISPLLETPFTRCKSDIKFLDYAAIGAAGIYSQSQAYSATVKHKENGWIARNVPEAWEEALETLIEGRNLRINIARKATRYLYSERILAQRAMDWVQTIQQVLA
jgi:glycosyltransferase involved in cell wall biosynthesis